MNKNGYPNIWIHPKINELQENFNTDLDKAIKEFITKNNINPYLTIDDKFTYTFKPNENGHWEIKIFKE